MKKPLLSALGLGIALAFSMPALGNAAATTTAPAASTMTPAPAKAAPKKVTTKKVCKPTKTHKCPVKHKKHAAKTAAPKKTY
ncbi:hypothetical protein [Mesorhizobium sp. B1-1-8]|uniref:hypothetical protein n=1 Tax=Mesorhizobium sp. B1-1-8 TaxID=2589976 RepID=UPI00112D84ED|nr:hypothetical protein [Mesorhizobium sp. B1-1-8]UCI05264.1 hypothetical protein FJ974_15490 [Mesorhizobium sp. B1-1-8]